MENGYKKIIRTITAASAFALSLNTIAPYGRVYAEETVTDETVIEEERYV